MTKRHLSCETEIWPIAGSFRIARGARTEAVVVVVTLAAGDHKGRGECVPYARYGETPESVCAQIEGIRDAIEAGLTRADLQALLPAGAARNAVDCALWDLDAKLSSVPVAKELGLGPLRSVTTAYTISLADDPADMEKAARLSAARPLLKVKLGGGEGDQDRIKAVRLGAPDAQLIIDANEGWTADTLQANLDACASVGVTLIEQPLPASDDGALAGASRTVPVCADESAHDSQGLPALVGRYDFINIKIDKTGGLTEALTLAQAAKAANMRIMVGCMVATSLAMAPVFLLAQSAEIVDLDGPLLLATDREPGFSFDGSLMHPAGSDLWGG